MALCGRVCVCVRAAGAYLGVPALSDGIFLAAAAFRPVPPRSAQRLPARFARELAQSRLPSPIPFGAFFHFCFYKISFRFSFVDPPLFLLLQNLSRNSPPPPHAGLPAGASHKPSMHAKPPFPGSSAHPPLSPPLSGSPAAGVGGEAFRLHLPGLLALQCPPGFAECGSVLCAGLATLA